MEIYFVFRCEDWEVGRIEEIRFYLRREDLHVFMADKCDDSRYRIVARQLEPKSVGMKLMAGMVMKMASSVASLASEVINQALHEAYHGRKA